MSVYVSSKRGGMKRCANTSGTKGKVVNVDVQTRPLNKRAQLQPNRQRECTGSQSMTRRDTRKREETAKPVRERNNP